VGEPMLADSSGRLATASYIRAGERLPAGLLRTCPDTLSVPGGQVLSVPVACPTGRSSAVSQGYSQQVMHLT
jgi:hypothetical protein